jgi:predicted nucleotide-binding protein (sugar kinase/HSP70/actin superfamily)
VHEKDILNELVGLAEKQQRALVEYDINALNEIVSYQDALSKNLRETEEKRIRLLMNWLQISRSEAMKIRLSAIEKSLKSAEQENIKELRMQLNDLMARFKNFNTTNRVLANKGKNGTAQMLAMFKNGNNSVCNVRI